MTVAFLVTLKAPRESEAAFVEGHEWSVGTGSSSGATLPIEPSHEEVTEGDESRSGGYPHVSGPQTGQHWNISTLRRELWWLPAEWVKRGNRNYLRLPARYPRQDLFRKIQTAASRGQPLI